MKVSAKAEYACLAVIALADRRDDPKPTPIREIADAYGISETFLTQILIQLKGAGLVVSTRGSSGGYRLARDPGTISLGEVIRVIEGQSEHDAARPSRGPASMVLGRLWGEIQNAQTFILDRTSIARVAEESRAAEWII